MVSVVIQQVDASIRKMDNWIRYPTSMEEKNSMKDRFLMQFDMYNIVGGVDGTHVAIVKPPTANAPDRGFRQRRRLYREEDYVNRKRYRSMNVQIICDACLRILSLNAAFPGRSHDSFVWANSRISQVIQTNYKLGEVSFALGDSGYPQAPWLLTPILNTAIAAEEGYNAVQIQARATVERCIGLLKGKFRCLLKH